MEVNFYEMYLEEMALIPVLEAEEEENSYDGVDFNEAMATMQNAAALTRDTSGAAGGATHGSPATSGFHSSEASGEMAAGNGASDETASRQSEKNPKSSRQEIANGIRNLLKQRSKTEL